MLLTLKEKEEVIMVEEEIVVEKILEAREEAKETKYVHTVTRQDTQLIHATKSMDTHLVIFRILRRLEM